MYRSVTNAAEAGCLKGMYSAALVSSDAIQFSKLIAFEVDFTKVVVQTRLILMQKNTTNNEENGQMAFPSRSLVLSSLI